MQQSTMCRRGGQEQADGTSQRGRERRQLGALWQELKVAVRTFIWTQTAGKTRDGKDKKKEVGGNDSTGERAAPGGPC